MRSAMFWTVVVCALVCATTWRSDVAASGPGSGSGPGTGSGSSGIAPPEPITGEALMPNPGSESEQAQPFTMYSNAGSASWSYSQLNPDEQAWVDNEPNTGGDWQVINDVYAAAARERAQEAAASAAATQLGASNLGATGVVP